MASWTMSPGFMVSFRLLEMLFIGAERPEKETEGKTNFKTEAQKHILFNNYIFINLKVNIFL